MRRRRECLSCGERFTTFEMPELVHAVRRQTRRSPRAVRRQSKLRNGFLNALQKRPVQREDIERSIEHIEHHLQTTRRARGAEPLDRRSRHGRAAPARRGGVRALRVRVSQLPRRDGVSAGDRAAAGAAELAREPRADVAAAGRRQAARSSDAATTSVRCATSADSIHEHMAARAASRGERPVRHEAESERRLRARQGRPRRRRRAGPRRPAARTRSASRSPRRAQQARGATAYVTLEPCCHTGRTGPCTKALIEAGVARVVYAGARSESARERRRRARARKRPASRVDGGVLEQRGGAAESRLLRAHAARPSVGAQQARREPRRPHGARERREPMDHGRGRARRRASVARALGRGAHRQRHDRRRRSVARCAPRAKRASTRRSASSSRCARSSTRVCKTPPTAKTLSLPGEVLCSPRAALDDAGRGSAARAPALASSAWPATRSTATCAPCSSVSRELEINDVWVEAGAGLNGALLQAGLIDELIMYMAPKLLGDSARGHVRRAGARVAGGRLESRLRRRPQDRHGLADHGARQ